MYIVAALGDFFVCFCGARVPGRPGEGKGSDVRIIKKINNNAALGLDGSGTEVVVLGKGIGFADMPYELTDYSKIQRTFYDMDPRYVQMAAGIPDAVLEASADIAEQAEMELECELNPNLPFTLADHLNFALERLRSGTVLTTPLSYDVRHLYPKEAELGRQALDILEAYTGTRLPDSEAISVALHLINAESESEDIHSTLLALKITEEVNAIIEKELKIRLDKDSFQYSRFAMHLRYLIQRLMSGQQVDDQGVSLLGQIRREYPEIYVCAKAVVEYFASTWNWQCNDEELLYLMLHIYRVQQK